MNFSMLKILENTTDLSFTIFRFNADLKISTIPLKIYTYTRTRTHTQTDILVISVRVKK